jgi:hypothetical protein
MRKSRPKLHQGRLLFVSRGYQVSRSCKDGKGFAGRPAKTQHQVYQRSAYLALLLSLVKSAGTFSSLVTLGFGALLWLPAFTQYAEGGQHGVDRACYCFTRLSLSIRTA